MISIRLHGPSLLAGTPGLPHQLDDHSAWYLLAALLCLFAALRYMKRALEPVGALVQAVAAAAVVAFTVGVAVVLLTAALLSRH
jgi:hypothetical protein